MKEESSSLLLRAEEAIESAELLLKGGYPADSISRAYYAMFYVAEALLNEKMILMITTKDGQVTVERQLVVEGGEGAGEEVM